jgi:hypothetical protein
MHPLALRITAKRLHIVAQGRPELVEGRTLGSDPLKIGYAEGVTQLAANRLCNSFGVTCVFNHEPRVRGCAATLGYGVKRLRRWSR